MWITLFILLNFLIMDDTIIPPDVSEKLSFTVVYDNYVLTEGTKADWGFSCLIEGTEKSILFDCGTNPDILIHNFQTLDIEFSVIDLLVFSHEHRDHTGGKKPVLEANPEMPVFILPSFTEQLKNELVEYNAEVISVPQFTQICKNVYLTGPMGDKIKEQSLIVDTPKGLVIVTGCSHPGIVNIIKKSVDHIHRPVYLVFGGFHMLRDSEDQIKKTIAAFHQLGVQYCGSTHCTGENAIALFKADFEDSFVPIGTGKKITIETD